MVEQRLTYVDVALIVSQSSKPTTTVHNNALQPPTIALTEQHQPSRSSGVNTTIPTKKNRDENSENSGDTTDEGTSATQVSTPPSFLSASSSILSAVPVSFPSLSPHLYVAYR